LPHTLVKGSAFDRIRAKIGVESAPIDSVGIPGLYVNPPDQLAEKSDPSVVRSNLYLLPDHTYLYAERDSFLAVTIFDKGIWTLGSGVLEVKSDSDIRWNPDWNGDS
jgi:hypothetical protein